MSVTGKWEGGRKCIRLKFGLAVEVKDNTEGLLGNIRDKSAVVPL